MMKNTLKIALSTSLVAALAASTSYAQTSETFQATATVTTSIGIAENTPLNFGTLAVVQDGTNPASGTLAPDGTFTATASTGTETLIQLDSPAAGNFTIDVGAALAVNVEVTFPGEITLSYPDGTDTSATFTVDTFTIGSLLPGGGSFSDTTTTAADCNTAIDDTAGGNCRFTTATTGQLTFSLGARIEVDSATATYDEGAYTGDFDLVAAYY